MTETSLTREETNALRESLGLPPLADNTSKRASNEQQQEQQHSHPHDSEDQQSDIFQLRANLERRKAQRQSNRLLNGPTLGEQLMFQTAGSAAKWIERQKQHVENQSAATLSTSTDCNRDAGQSTYGSSELQGLIVRHSFDDFDALGEDQSEIVLTLADRNILDDNMTDNAGDELESSQFAHQHNHNQTGKPHSTVSPSEPVSSGQQIVLGASGVYQKSEEDQRRATQLNALIQERAMFGLDDSDLRPSKGGQHYDLNQQSQVLESDYKPVKFNKKRKRASPSVVSEISLSTTDLADTASDRQSRFAPTTISQDELFRSEEQRRKQAGFLNALEASNRSTASRVQQDRSQTKRSNITSFADYDEENAATARVFSQVRRSSTLPIASSNLLDAVSRPMASVKQLSSTLSERVASHILSVSQTFVKQGPKDSSLPSDNSSPVIVLSTTSAFVTGLSVQNETDDTRSARSRKTCLHEADAPSQSKTAKVASDDEEDGQLAASSDDDEDEGVFDDEPIAGESVAAALELFKRRAHLDPHVAKRDKFDLVKYDALGNPMSKKEQFRELSHQFHGQGAGITKRDKRLKSIKREQRQTKREHHQIATGQGRDTKIQQVLQKNQTAFIVLDKATAKNSSS